MKLVDSEHDNQQYIKKESCMNTIEVKQNVPEISKLSEIGKTYVYGDSVVIPSQYYAKFSGKPTKVINQALKRIINTDRVTEEEDVFFLTRNEAIDFGKVTGCDLQLNHGLTLLTRKAVNTLSHYFDDEHSIELSKSVNNIATKVMESERPYLAVAKQIILAMEERDSTINTLITANDDDTLTSSQISELDALISSRYREYDKNGVVCGLIKKRIKQEFFDRPGSRTYKEIPRRGFERAKQIVRQWEPTLRQQEKYGLTIKRAGTGGDQ